MIRKSALWILAAVALPLLIPAGAQAATVSMATSRPRNLSGWQVFNSTDKGNWFVYSGDKTPFQKEEGDGKSNPADRTDQRRSRPSNH